MSRALTHAPDCTHTLLDPSTLTSCPPPPPYTSGSGGTGIKAHLQTAPSPMRGTMRLSVLVVTAMFGWAAQGAGAATTTGLGRTTTCPIGPACWLRMQGRGAQCAIA